MESRLRQSLGLCALLAVAAGAHAEVTEFCLEGFFDLGARYQGLQPAAGETYPARWCVVTETEARRVRLHLAGRSNPDMDGDFTVTYLPPDTVRIVNADDPPDLDFRPAAASVEAARLRRMDPRRLVAELRAHPGWVSGGELEGWQAVDYPGETAPVEIRVQDGRLRELRTAADLPLRGTVPVTWRWDWSDPAAPQLELVVDGEVFLRAEGCWRPLEEKEADGLWAPSGGEEPRTIPGDAWPAQVNMRLEELARDVYRVRGVRTGFHHLVVDTDAGLVVADAPAGWVELPHIPPADLVPGLGVSGLSERMVDFLEAEFPGRAIRAVVLTHAHDDHAGGARAYAAAGADIYAPAEVAPFLARALNRANMPPDRLGDEARVDVQGVSDQAILADPETEVVLMNIGPGPHAAASMGAWVPSAGVFYQSDLHVPVSDSEAPRADRSRTECWFARWAVANLPPETEVLNSHTLLATPVSRLASYAAHPLCTGEAADEAAG